MVIYNNGDFGTVEMFHEDNTTRVVWNQQPVFTLKGEHEAEIIMAIVELCKQAFDCGVQVGAEELGNLIATVTEN